jgi:RNA polymerase sigma-70 factor (ECF subfamily)
LSFEQDFCFGDAHRIVQCERAERSLEHRRRDVYETHKHRAFAVAYYMVGNEIDAEEVTQQTFLRAFRQVEEPDGRCVDHSLVTELRDRVDLEEQLPLPEAEPAREIAGRNVKRTDMEEALRELPAGERMVFLLRDVEGYDADRVAELLQQTRQQVERTLFAARLRMRSAIARMQQTAAAA